MVRNVVHIFIITYIFLKRKFYRFRNAPRSSRRECKYADPATIMLPIPRPPTTKFSGPVFGSSIDDAGTIFASPLGTTTAPAVDTVDAVLAATGAD